MRTRLSVLLPVLVLALLAFVPAASAAGVGTKLDPAARDAVTRKLVKNTSSLEILQRAVIEEQAGSPDGTNIEIVTYSLPGRDDYRVELHVGGKVALELLVDGKTYDVLAQRRHHVSNERLLSGRQWGGSWWAGHTVNAWWLCLLLGIAFVLVAANGRRLTGWLVADMAGLLAFVPARVLFASQHDRAAKLLVVVPLAYWVVRGAMLLLRDRPERLTAAEPERGWRMPRLPAVALLAIAVAGFAGAIAVEQRNTGITDVQLASVAGAEALISDRRLYGNPQVAQGLHLDTYGIFTYMAYVPALHQVGGVRWVVKHPGKMPDIVPVTNDVVLVLAGLLLAIAGWRRVDRRTGLTVLAAWAVFPETWFLFADHGNDILVAGLAALLVAAWNVPALRGAVLGLGFGTKFVPVAALGSALHHGSRERGKQALLVAFCCAVAVVASIVAVVAGGSLLKDWYHSTLHFQLNRVQEARGDELGSLPVWWDYLHVPDAIRAGARYVAGLALLATLFVPLRRTARGALAGAAASLALLQLVGFYFAPSYLGWYLPILVALVALPAIAWREPAPKPEKVSVEGAGDEGAGDAEHSGEVLDEDVLV